MLPNNNVSMSVGHLDHVLLTVYSSMEHVTWRELLQLIDWGDRQEVWSEYQRAQERSGLFHSWYTDPSIHGNSQVSHHRPCPWKRTISSTVTRQKWSTERHSDRPDG